MTMTALVCDATSRTPAVRLDPEAGIFTIIGESYPEDVTGFYGPIKVALDEAASKITKQFNIEIRLMYFNSSSARMLMEMMKHIDQNHPQKCKIKAKWYCHPDDDITREFAEDVGEGLRHIEMTVIEDANI